MPSKIVDLSARSEIPTTTTKQSAFFGKGEVMLFFQAKLTMNDLCDTYEQEADTVADKVMRMPDHFSILKQN